MKHELEPWGRGPNGAWLPQQQPVWPADHFSQATQLRSQLQRYANALRRRWWIPLLSLLLVGGPAVVFAYYQPPTFQSRAKMWLTPRQLFPNQPGLNEGITSYIDTQAQLIKDPVIQAPALQRVRTQFPQLRAAKGGALAGDSPFELSVRTSQRSSVLELRANGAEPEPTRAFLDAVMKEYQLYKEKSKTRTSSGALSSINEQIAEFEKQLQQQRDQLTRFETSNNVVYWNEYRVNAGTQLARLEGELSELRTDQRLLGYLTPLEFKELRPATIGQLGPGAEPPPASPGADQAFYQGLQQLNTLEARYADFAAVLRPTHSKMLKLRQEIKGLKQLLDQLQQKDKEQALVRMNNRKKQLELQIQDRESRSQEWQTNAAQASRILVEHERMRQDLQRSQAQYDHLVELRHQVDLNNNVEQEPLVPIAAASPARPTLSKYGTAAAGLFLGLLVGLGAFMFLAFLDDRFISARELSLQLPAEVVAQVPRARLGRPGKPQRLLPENAAFAESFRNLRSAVFFMNGQANQPKVVLVTSSIPKEGKSTVAANLARTLALSGSRVLLMDADLRRSSIHLLFKVPPGPGLLEVLSQGVEPAQVIVPSEEPTLFILPAGTEGNPSSDLFLGPTMEQLLQELRQQYHYIVIDTAPVLATDDAASLGPQADGAFLVVRAGYTSSRMAREALERLQQRNVKILGTVYNGASPSKDYYCQYSRAYYGSAKAARRD